MKTLLAVVVAIAATSAGWAQSALGQESADRGVPVEFFACNWQKGKDMDDLQKVTEKFNEWADANDDKYSAWILTPQFHSGLEYDFGWMGSWPDGNAFGAAQDRWMSEDNDLAAEFDKVADCSGGHQLATAAIVRAPDGPPDNGIVSFSRCTLKEGVSPADVLPAHRDVAATMTGLGANASAWLFYPGMGSGDIDFHYWSVLAWTSYTNMGNSLEIYTNGGGWQKVAGILAPVTSCASPVVFDARLVRAAPTDS